MAAHPALAQAQQVMPAPEKASASASGPAASIVSTQDGLSAAFDLTAPSPGFTYFYKSGASIADHDEAVRACGRHAVRMVQPQDTSAAAAGAAGGLLGALVMGAVSGYIQGKRNTRALGANLENCMVVEGWTVRRIADAEGEILDKLEQPALHDAIALRVSAVTPGDEQVRVFGNELKHKPPAAFGWAGDMDALSLSLQALPPADKSEAATPRPRLPRQPRSARAPRPLTEAQLAVAPETGIVVVKLKGEAWAGGRSLTFVRASSDPDAPAWVADQLPDRFVATLTSRAAVRGDTNRYNMLAFAVPPGRWRLASVTQNLFSLNLCRGAPAFDVRAGQAVFAGEFDMSGVVAVPDTDIADADLPPAYAILSPAAAVWTDGGPSSCEGAYLYAAFLGGPRLAPAALNSAPVSDVERAAADEASAASTEAPVPPKDVQSAPAQPASPEKPVVER